MLHAFLTALLALLPPQDPKTLTLTYQNGELVTAQVLGLQDDAVTLRVMVLGGQMQVKRKLADFTPASVFAIELEARRPEGYEQHFAMAQRAAELGLVGLAGQQARLAVEACGDGGDGQAKRAEVRKWAADAVERLLTAAIGESRLADANHYLKILSTRLADQRTEEQLDALAGMVEALENQQIEKRQQARQSRLEAKARAEIERKMKPIQKHLADGDKSLREAIRRSNTTVAAANLCEKAIDHYRTAFRALQALVEKHPDDADLARDAEALGTHLHDHAIRAALQAANMLTVQSNYKGAMEWANRVLAFEPDNAEAKEMVRTIQIAQAAASSQWGWGWQVGGGLSPQPRKN
ncbi:MAG: hypothetical protein KF830_10375 [Planctomycetes bacterium]|nr:hypothetical protein [Planctomycetota bacterium]